MGLFSYIFGGGCQQRQQCYYPQQQTYYCPQEQYCQPQQMQYYYSQPQQEYYCPQQWSEQPQYYQPSYNNSPCGQYPSANTYTTQPGCNTGCNQGSTFSTQSTSPSYNQTQHPVNKLNPNIPDGRNVDGWNQLYRDAGISGANREIFMRDYYVPLQQYQSQNGQSNDEFNVNIYQAIQDFKSKYGAGQPNLLLPPPPSNDNGEFVPVLPRKQSSEPTPLSPTELQLPEPEGSPSRGDMPPPIPAEEFRLPEAPIPKETGGARKQEKSSDLKIA